MEPTGGPAVEPVEEVRDFTIRRPPIQFRIDDDVFSAPAIISAITLKRIAGQRSALADLGKISDLDDAALGVLFRKLGDVFKTLIPGPSGQLFAARLLVGIDDADNAEPDDNALLPIDLMQQALPVLYYLLERYGLRPTTPSSSSVSSVAGGGSTDGAPVEESTPIDSTPSDS